MDGPDALNRFISAGEVEELLDLLPQNDESDDESDTKRSKVDHKAQVIYNKEMSAQQVSGQPFIRPLMAVNVDVPLGGSGADKDSDYRSLNNGDIPYNQPVFGGANNPPPTNQPPSLLNINVAPPFDDDMPGGSWSKSRHKDGKRRNRDSDGNRISRFDRESERSSRFDGGDSGRRRSGRQERSSGRNSKRRI